MKTNYYANYLKDESKQKKVWGVSKFGSWHENVVN